MTYDEYKRRKDELVRDIDQNHWKLMLKMAQNALALIRQRTVEKGTNPDNIAFQTIQPYTKQYLKYKTKKGKYRGKVDFTLKSRLWPNTAVALNNSYIERKNITNYKAIITPKAEFNKMLMEVHTKRRGTILNLSKQEIEQIKKAYEYDLIQVFKKHGLA